MMPPITKNLLIINVLCYFASLAFASHGVDFDELFGLHFFLASHFQPWQFFTYMFMHANLQHLFFNMFAVWMFGRIMEQTMGSKRFKSRSLFVPNSFFKMSLKAIICDVLLCFQKKWLCTRLFAPCIFKPSCKVTKNVWIGVPLSSFIAFFAFRLAI